ncbi:uncharacterized protein LOC126746856 [Anthonomus grandis grandis]|uniref:uncharacterized protein LOC126746856 n=1 Tax=Anthonomus grandis grandis TaxID=2921223 RepID=UPI002166573B|nr:uncharacterized protein LOC126746856 [Anthonomus grandis grandis]
MVKIGINGFGRLGRLFLRIALDQCGKGAVGADFPVVTIVNDPNLNSESMAALLQKDTYRGTFKKEVIDMDNCIMIEGNRVEAVKVRDISKVPWHKSCPIDYIVDTTGKNKNCAQASKFLQEKIKCVVVSGLGDIPVFAVGVNHTCYKPAMKIVSVGTPTLNCLAPILRVLHENFTIEKAMATSLHPLKNHNKFLDDSCPSANLREGRSALGNFFPCTSAAPGRYVSRIMPELEGRTDSNAIKVPTVCVGAVDLTAVLCKEVSHEIVTVKLKEAADCYMRNVMKYSTDELVSSDIIGDPHSCVIDSKACMGLAKNVVKIFAWYDAEYAFAHRLYDMVKYIASREICTK